MSSLFAPSQLPNASVSSADLSGLRGEFFASITHRRPKQVIAFPLHRVHRSSGFTPLAFSRSRAALFTLSCEGPRPRSAPSPIPGHGPPSFFHAHLAVPSSRSMPLFAIAERSALFLSSRLAEKCVCHRGSELQLRHKCSPINRALAPEELTFDFFCRVPHPRFVRVGLGVSSLPAPSQFPNASVSSADRGGLRGEFFASPHPRRPKQCIESTVAAALRRWPSPVEARCCLR